MLKVIDISFLVISGLEFEFPVLHVVILCVLFVVFR